VQDIVNAICDDDDIKAISFVGSNVVSHLILVWFLHFMILCYSSFGDLKLPEGNPYLSEKLMFFEA